VAGWDVYLTLMWHWTGNTFEGFVAQKHWAVHSVHNLWDVPKFIIGFLSPTQWHAFRGSFLDRCAFVLLLYTLPALSMAKKRARSFGMQRAFDPARPEGWTLRGKPRARHGNGANLAAFADGHVERRERRDPRTFLWICRSARAKLPKGEGRSRGARASRPRGSAAAAVLLFRSAGVLPVSRRGQDGRAPQAGFPGRPGPSRRSEKAAPEERGRPARGLTRPRWPRSVLCCGSGRGDAQPGRGGIGWKREVAWRVKGVQQA